MHILSPRTLGNYPRLILLALVMAVTIIACHDALTNVTSPRLRPHSAFVVSAIPPDTVSAILYAMRKRI